MPGIPIIDKMETSEFRKVLLPMIRQVMPNLIASQILGVQPMSGTVGQIFTTKYSFDPTEVLFRNYPPLVHNMVIVHTAIRPFMRGDDPEPNEHYRPWLEEHIGVQGVSWDWRIKSVTENSLAIDFADKEQATLFELTWP